MKINGESILKLIGIKNPKNYKAKSIVLKDKQLFPDIHAWPVIGDDNTKIFFEFQDYKDKMIRFRTSAKVSLLCAHTSHSGPVHAAIIFTEQKYQDYAIPMSIESPDKTTIVFFI